MSEPAVEIRPCTELQEFEACVELQRQVWQFADLDLVPAPVFVVVRRIGGQILGAFAGNFLVGFLLSFPAWERNRVYLHSHMTAVLPAYQGKGIGRRLKWAQREEALSRGFALVEWTFDPLVLRNAHFNINCLGVIARNYARNQYGASSSPLHAHLPTDRLLAEWWLESPRVHSLLAGQKLKPRGPVESIAIPAQIAELRHRDPAAAARSQARAREQFEQWFARGYAVTGFTSNPETATYLLEPHAD